MWGWLKNRRRRKWIKKPFPKEWEQLLSEDFSYWDQLPDTQQSEFRNFIQIFTREKNWEGCGGLEISDEVRVLISVQVAMMALNFQDFYFDQVQSILVYPDAYRAPMMSQNRLGVVDDHGSARLGEAWWRGPVILSWKHSLQGARGLHDENLVCHEFAHQLDMLNGQNVDGFPPMADINERNDWHDVMTQGYNTLQKRCQKREPSVIRCYGARNPGEFLAVSTESYFASPQRLQQDYPEVYRVLERFYGFHARIAAAR